MPEPAVRWAGASVDFEAVGVEASLLGYFAIEILLLLAMPWQGRAPAHLQIISLFCGVAPLRELFQKCS
ncbi:MAG TPA: hypothetical protein VKC60_12895 [Opitutaceae bacterium]|nr:hypothetical protein [Opitutaceae bacterium]